jgi:hypothetical protein
LTLAEVVSGRSRTLPEHVQQSFHLPRHFLTEITLLLQDFLLSHTMRIQTAWSS